MSFGVRPSVQDYVNQWNGGGGIMSCVCRSTNWGSYALCVMVMGTPIDNIIQVHVIQPQSDSVSGLHEMR